MNGIKWTSICTISALLGFLAMAQATTIAEPQPWPEGGNVLINVSSPVEGTTRMVYDIPEFESETVMIDGEAFTTARIPGESHTSEIGRPELPMINRVIGIPDLGAVRLRVVSAEFTETQGLRIYPMQPWAQENQENHNRPFTQNQEFYRTSDWYPSQIAQISEPAVMRDVRVAVVSICPVQYNASTGTVRTYSNVEVVVEPTGEPGVNEKTRHFDQISSTFLPLYRGLANFDELGLDEGPTLPGEILIVCANNANVLTYVNQLADWKRRRGSLVTVATRDETGNSFSQIASYVQNFYNTHNLEFLILIGDATTNSGDPYSVPASSSGYYGTDHLYTTVAGGDNLADFAVGRLSVNSLGELQVVINKSIRYERNPYMGQTHWYTRAYLLAGTAHTCASNVYTKEWVRQQLYRHGYDDVPLDTHYGHINASLMRQQVGVGCTFFNWRGSWIGEFSTGDINGLSNGWMLPQVITITCSTGGFTGTGACLSEAWLRYGSVANGNGGIGCIATATSATHVNYNNLIDSGYFYGFMVRQMPEAGLALMETKFQFYRNYYPWESTMVNNYFNWVNLMGDPELKTWTAVPIILDVDHPTTLAVGCNQVEIAVTDELNEPVPEILVTAMGDDTYSRGYTDQNGTVVLPITLEDPGNLYITTWKHNYHPYEGSITVTQENLSVAFQQLDIDDDNSGGTSGNSDGFLNPGEVVDLEITLHNYGSSQTATDVVGVLSSLDLNTAQIITSTQTFPNMSPGASATSNNDFRISVDDYAQDQELARLLLEVTASGNDQTSLIELPINSGDVEYTNHQFTGSNNRLDPGETETLLVTVTNLGHHNITGATGRLVSTSNFVSFPTPTATYGTINQGSSVTNAVPFQITANPMTFPGARVRIGVAFQGSNSFFDTTYFDINIGQISSSDPTGPDEYGYYAFDDTDTGYEMCPEYDWIEIDYRQTGGLEGTMLPLNDLFEDDDESMTVDLPFTFQMYGQSSNQLTICTNGWVALGDQDQFLNFRNWHVPGPQGPDLMICPFWDDLVTTNNGKVFTYHDAANGWFIVEWSRLYTRYQSHQETFEVLLYDPGVWPTLTGDGIIKFQYQTIYQGTAASNDNDYSTIGIENDTQDIGLELSYWNTYTPGIAGVQAGRAYLITNMVSFQVGALEGTVADAATGDPLVGAFVSTGNGSYWDTTDASGYYFIPDMLISEYTVMCDIVGYNPAEATVTILENQTSMQDFDLLHPEFELDVTGITETLSQGESTERTFHLNNNGNGTLEYEIGFDFHLYDAPLDRGTGQEETINHLREGRGPIATPSGTDDPWDLLLDFNVTFETGDRLIQGAAFAWGSFWVVGGGLVSSNPNEIYQFDPMGNYIGHIQQPSNTVFGFKDLAYDGEFLWGSEDQWIVAFDTTGTVHDSIAGQLNPNRCLAYDPGEDVFYIGDITAPIYAIDREGAVVREFSGHGLAVYGLAWFRDDPDGYPLYLFCRTGPSDGIQVQKMNTSTGETEYVADLFNTTGDRAGGAMVTTSWNPLFYTLVGQLVGQSEDKVAVWEIGPNTAWITFGPTSGTVLAGGQETFTVELDANDILPGEYGVNLVFQHNAITQSDTLPVRLTVTSTGVNQEEGPIPFTYSLDQNYPNPFNPVTVIPYSIRDHVRVTLDVYNILGQRIARLVNQVQEPGQYKAMLEVDHLSSGVYFYSLKAGTFSMTRKMVILK